MNLKKEFFQEADKAIAEFESVYEFFKTAKSHNAYQDGARRSSEDLVERFYRDNHNYKRNEKRKRERRLKRKLEALDLILKMEGWD